MVNFGPGLGDGRGVAQHDHSAQDFGQVPAWDDGRRLVVHGHLLRDNKVYGFGRREAHRCILTLVFVVVVVVFFCCCCWWWW